MNNKQIIKNFFQAVNTKDFKYTAKQYAMLLNIDLKNLLTWLWCLQRRDSELIYFIDEDKNLQVKVIG